MYKNGFTEQFDDHIKFVYSFFYQLIIQGYILEMFASENVIALLCKLSFSQQTNGVIKLLVEQLSTHIKKEPVKLDIPILWIENLGENGISMQDYVQDDMVIPRPDLYINIAGGKMISKMVLLSSPK